MARVSRLPLLRSRWSMRLVLLVLLVVFALLAFFPERHRAAVTMTPTDPVSMGLSGTLGQLGAINSVFGNQTAVEVALKVGRSQQVRDIVIAKNDLARRLQLSSTRDIHRYLERNVEVRSLRGGIIQFEMLSRDPDLAHDVVADYAKGTQERLAQIARGQTEYKREVLVKLVSEASSRLAVAKGNYDRFRLANRAIIPDLALVSASSQVPTLEAAIRANEIELSTARQFNTDENIAVRQLIAQGAALRQQLAQARATDPQARNSVGAAVQVSRRGEQLIREVNIAQSLYDNYMKFLEGTEVEDLTSNASVRVLEPAFVDTTRQVNLAFAALAIAVFLLWLTLEVYRWAPPVGERIVRRDTVIVEEPGHA